MTFEEWFKAHGIEFASFAEKSAARKGWNAGAATEREECIEDVRTIGGSFAIQCEDLIRARGGN